MRRLISVVLSTAVFALGVPATGGAQRIAPADVLRGQVVHASGTGAAVTLIELVSDNRVVATATTADDGRFEFSGVAPGAYLVRTTVNGFVSAVRVAVTAGRANASALLVLPSLAKAAPQGYGGGAGWVAGGVMQIATIVGVIAVSVNNDDNDDSYLEQHYDESQEYGDDLANELGLGKGTFGSSPASLTQ